MKKRSRLYVELVLKSWWTILFFLGCFFAYDQASQRKKGEEKKLEEKLNHIILAKKEAMLVQEELSREIASLDDDHWIELILMQKLGLVPEGQTKVHFSRKHE